MAAEPSQFPPLERLVAVEVRQVETERRVGRLEDGLAQIAQGQAEATARLSTAYAELAVKTASLAETASLTSQTQADLAVKVARMSGKLAVAAAMGGVAAGVVTGLILNSLT